MQVEHKTEKGTVLFVKVPDGAYNFSNNMQPNQLDYYTDTAFNGSKLTFSECIILTKVDWQLIGPTSEVTEEQAYNMGFDGEVEILDWPSNTDRPIVKEHSPVDQFKSLMQHLQVYKFNPYGKERPRCSNYSSLVQYLGDAKDFDKAQLNVGKWVVLFKQNEK